MITYNSTTHHGAVVKTHTLNYPEPEKLTKFKVLNMITILNVDSHLYGITYWLSEDQIKEVLKLPD